MKTLCRRGVPQLLAILLLCAITPLASPAQRYVCPPCGLPCDTTSFTAPGACPGCGMTLVESGSDAAKPAVDPDRKRVAILIFDGVEILDFTGPYEMFGAAGCDVYTVAASRNPVTSAMGLTVVPKFSLSEAPQPDVLVIPGGGVYGASQDSTTLRYVRDVTARAGTTMSVCNGAFILAAAGLLDGLTATTTYGNIPKLASEYPKVKVVEDRRYVDNGKIITTAGLSAGMDGALHVIARLFGTGSAETVALREEYDWKPDGGFVRAAQADHQIPAVQFQDVGTWTVVRTEGDTNRWDIVLSGHSDLATSDLLNHIEEALAKGKWTKVTSAVPSASTQTSDWRFTGTDGKRWNGTLKVEGGGNAVHEFTAALSIARGERGQ